MIWREIRDLGDSQKVDVGVYRDAAGYIAFIVDEWGGGWKCPRSSFSKANQTAELLYERYLQCQ